MGFQEGERAWIGKPSAEAWQFLVDDEALPSCADDASRWLWTPGFYAGEVTAVLLDPGGNVRAHYLLDVSPSPDKTGRKAFDEMVAELRDLEPALLVGTEPPMLASGALGRHTDPMIEFARYRRFVPEFLRVLERIQAQSIHRLRVDRAELPVNQIRRVDAVTARSALRSPTALAFLKRDGASPDSTLPPRLNVPLIEKSDDSAANRCLVALGLGIVRRAQAITFAFESQVQKIDDQSTRTDMSERWKVRSGVLRELEHRTRKQLQSPPFRRVSRPEITSAGLNAIAAHPLYARAWRLGWKALRPGVAGELQKDRLWTSPTWEVYERWCFARLSADLAKLRSDLSWTAVEFGGQGACARVTGRSRSESIEILFQPGFPGRKDRQEGLWSISKGRFPDIVITHAKGSSHRFYVLDAKYRVSRANVVDAMESAHLYHDSLRWDALRPAVSLLLVPRGGGADWLEEPAYRVQHGVGVAELSVGTGSAILLRELGLGRA